MHIHYSVKRKNCFLIEIKIYYFLMLLNFDQKSNIQAYWNAFASCSNDVLLTFNSLQRQRMGMIQEHVY